jgi:mannose-6-phosphate isomerase-like protein (cupin superfamily)
MSADSSTSVAVVSVAGAEELGPPPPGNLAVPVFGHGTLEVEWYAPVGMDRQTPHDRDEVYVVARGSADFFDGVHSRRVEPGAFIFIAAGREHRFVEFSADFAVWVFFYGPAGGEMGPG